MAALRGPKYQIAATMIWSRLPLGFFSMSAQNIPKGHEEVEENVALRIPNVRTATMCKLQPVKLNIARNASWTAKHKNVTNKLTRKFKECGSWGKEAVIVSKTLPK